MDELSGRVFIKLAIGGNIESVPESFLKPVSKDEYSKSSRVINSDKYEEYKNRETTKSNERTNSSHYSKSRDRKSDDERFRSASSSKKHSKERSDNDSNSDNNKISQKKSSNIRIKNQSVYTSCREVNTSHNYKSSDDNDEHRSKKKTSKKQKTAISDT